MTQTIAVRNQKGGAGKTTIATNLAHALVLGGAKVLLVDADPQGSLRDWNEVNGGELIPVVGLDRESLAKDLAAVSGGCDYAVIDGAPHFAKLSAAAVKAADLVLIPVTPSSYDIWACADLLDIIQARRAVTNGQPKAAFVIRRFIQSGYWLRRVASTSECTAISNTRSRISRCDSVACIGTPKRIPVRMNWDYGVISRVGFML